MDRGRHRMRGILAATALAALLSACVGGVDRPRASRAVSSRPAASLPSSAAFRQCAMRLRQAEIRYDPLPNQDKGGGCGLIDTIRLVDYGTPTTNLGPLTCPLAEKFAGWVRYGVRPAAMTFLGADVVRVETFGTYSCRNIVGNPNQAGKRSQHASANAIDISAFVLANGRRISLEGDWKNGGDDARRFLRVVRDSACKRFPTVLSPDYNAAHYNHFHFDMGGRGGFCR